MQFLASIFLFSCPVLVWCRGPGPGIVEYCVDELVETSLYCMRGKIEAPNPKKCNLDGGELSEIKGGFSDQELNKIVSFVNNKRKQLAQGTLKGSQTAGRPNGDVVEIVSFIYTFDFESCTLISFFKKWSKELEKIAQTAVSMCGSFTNQEYVEKYSKVYREI